MIDESVARVGSACALFALACLLGACAGQSGVITVSLATAPDSTLLDSVQTLRLVVTEPHQELTAERTNGGFDIAVDLPATGAATRLLVAGFDAGGALVANGASPTFPVSAINSAIAIYMAPPNSVAVAPQSFDGPRAALASAPLPYGAIFAGGTDPAGAATDTVIVYNAYTHSLSSGMALPAPRSGMVLAVGLGNIAYMFGGRDGTGALTATMWRFDTSVAPAGSYADFGNKDGFARADELMLPIGDEHYLITGAPVAELSGLDGSVIARMTDPLPAAGATVTANDGVRTTLFAGPAGVVRYRTGTFTMLPITEAARAGAGVVALPGGKVAVLCGTTDAVRIDASSGAGDIIPGVPAAEKTGCAIAATSRHIVVAGGTLASGVDATVAVYDAVTFELVATASLVVPRTNAVALALTNDQILIAGGVDGGGAPISTIELFTPSN